MPTIDTASADRPVAGNVSSHGSLKCVEACAGVRQLSSQIGGLGALRRELEARLLSVHLQLGGTPLRYHQSLARHCGQLPLRASTCNHARTHARKHASLDPPSLSGTMGQESNHESLLTSSSRAHRSRRSCSAISACQDGGD
jgi:hypothetical protein